MAYRNLLSKSSGGAFAKWMLTQGYEQVPTKGQHEAMRFVSRDRCRSDTVVIYTKCNRKEHFSVQDKDCKLVRGFIEDQKEDK